MRIAIVNDSRLATEALCQAGPGRGGHELAWTARNADDALDHCGRDRPHLLLMSLTLPGIDGVEATRRIMARYPCAILVVTTSLMANCSKVFEAMGVGALDAVNAPLLEWPASDKGAQDLLGKIETVGKLVGIKGSPRAIRTPRQNRGNPLILIGASAGGPAALARVVSYLPAGFLSPIIVVQHVDAQFAPALRAWLEDQTPLRVRLAMNDDIPEPGTILIAGRDQHLVFSSQQRLNYTREPKDCLYYPSVDVLFQSTCRHWLGNVIGVLLTGMGRDGARGLLELRQNGHHTIAQDQLSSAVYGMPKAAAELRAATEILNLDRIGLRLRAFGTKGVPVHA